MPSLDDASGYHCLVGAVAHEEYAAYGEADSPAGGRRRGHRRRERYVAHNRSVSWLSALAALTPGAKVLAALALAHADILFTGQLGQRPLTGRHPVATRRR